MHFLIQKLCILPFLPLSLWGQANGHQFHHHFSLASSQNFWLPSFSLPCISPYSTCKILVTPCTSALRRVTFSHLYILILSEQISQWIQNRKLVCINITYKIAKTRNKIGFILKAIKKIFNINTTFPIQAATTWSWNFKASVVVYPLFTKDIIWHTTWKVQYAYT